MTTATLTIEPTRTVGALVAEHPALSRVFERVGIDYCCGGKKPLEQACREKGLDANTFIAMLAAVTGAPSGAGQADCAAMTMTALADHIEATHHAYLRRELPRLTTMAYKVASAHGARHEWTLELRDVLDGFVAEIASHMQKEEQILFPLIRQMEAGDLVAGAAHCGSIANPITVMEREHDAAGDALARMRRLTSDYQPPTGACNTFVALLDGLRELEEDMHRHVHAENSILFPRALAAEAGAR